ncbi:MAG: histidine kinase [Colwellia sp.]|nr:histidine kinase [Colwellia sp.]
MMTSPYSRDFIMEKRLFPFSYQTLIGGGVAVSAIFFLQALIPYISNNQLDNFNWLFESLNIVARYFLWMLITPLIYRYLHRLLWQLDRPLSTNLYSLMNGIVLAIAHSFISYWMFIAVYSTQSDMDLSSAMGHIMSAIYVGCVSSFVELWILIGLFSAIDYYKKYRQQMVMMANQEKELANAKLTAFRMQLHPHFLFNSFNSVMSLIDIDKLKAKDMLAELSILMRRLLASDRRHTVTVKDELSFISSYLEIEAIRFQDRLKISIDVAEALEDALLPNLILQPIVENAIKHGFAQSTQVCRISIQIKENDQHLFIRIEDNGVENPVIPKLPKSGGIGLQNVYRRLEQMFDTDFVFTVYAVNPRGFGVQLQMPLTRSSFS